MPVLVLMFQQLVIIQTENVRYIKLIKIDMQVRDMK